MEDNILDRTLYKQNKNMKRDEMEAFLKRIFENGYKKAVSELDARQKNDLAAWAYEVYSDFYKSNSGVPAEPEQVSEIVSRLSQKLTDKKMAVAEKPLQVYVNSKLASFQKRIEKELAQ